MEETGRYTTMYLRVIVAEGIGGCYPRKIYDALLEPLTRHYDAGVARSGTDIPRYGGGGLRSTIGDEIPVTYRR